MLGQIPSNPPSGEQPKVETPPAATTTGGGKPFDPNIINKFVAYLMTQTAIQELMNQLKHHKKLFKPE